MLRLESGQILYWNDEVGFRFVGEVREKHYEVTNGWIEVSSLLRFFVDGLWVDLNGSVLGEDYDLKFEGQGGAVRHANRGLVHLGDECDAIWVVDRSSSRERGWRLSRIE